MNKYERALKLFKKAGMNPTTHEELTAYRMGLKLMEEVEANYDQTI